MRHLHLGLGRFHRAHQAYYLANLGVPITAFSMRSSAEADALRDAGHRYTLRVHDGKDSHEISIGAIDEALFLGRDHARYFDLMEDPSIRTVTLTVTEKGYCCTASGELDLSHPDTGAFPPPYVGHSVVPLLVEGLRRRQARHSRPIALISCDNLVGNGRLLQRLCTSWAVHAGASFDGSLVTFPNSMVDRIVPSGSSPLLVETEAFHQWVIEDSFLEQRPAWEQPGLLFVAQVEPFELLKLRLLNAAHSFMAYYGQLRGWTYVHEAVTDPEIRPFLERLFFQEVGPSLEVPAPLSLRGYGEDLLRRFDNPALPHRLAQIAMDGSLKLPQRVLPSLAGSRVSRLCLHGWLTYMFLGLSGKRELPISDPYAQRMRETLRPSFEETVPIWLEVLGWNLPSETSLQG